MLIRRRDRDLALVEGIGDLRQQCAGLRRDDAMHEADAEVWFAHVETLRCWSCRRISTRITSPSPPDERASATRASSRNASAAAPTTGAAAAWPPVSG